MGDCDEGCEGGREGQSKSIAPQTPIINPSLSLSLSLSKSEECNGRLALANRHFAPNCDVSLVGLEENSSVSKNHQRRMTVRIRPSFPHSIKMILLHIILRYWDIAAVFLQRFVEETGRH